MISISESSAVGPAPLPPTDALLSLRTGKIRPLDGSSIRSAINKRARQGKWEVTLLGLVGDEHHYIHHGGPEKALHQYCAAHYDAWNAELPGREDLFKIGGFGENLSTRYMSEQNVCIGDVFRVGNDVLIQVTGPRQPCYKLNHRFQHKKASAMTQSTGRMGWYYRVVKTGFIEEGDEMQLTERINPTWSLARVQKYLYHENDNYEAFKELATLPALSEEMLDIFQKRLSHGAEDMSGRLEGDRLPVAWQPYKLVSKTSLTSRIKSFIFEVDNEDKGEDSQFGQFPFVRLRFGPEGSISRAYSVVSGSTNRFELGIARDDNSRGGSVYLHDQLHVGEVIKVAPGRSTTVQQSQDADDQVFKHIFIIGGIGVTAFLGEIERLVRESADVEVHYAVRSQKEAAYLDRLPLDKTSIYAKDQGQRLNPDQVIPTPHLEDGIKPVIYCCGPTSLMNACRTLTTTLHYPQTSVHFEEFGDATTGTGNPFEVEIKSTGKILQVPEKKSLLQVLSDAGFEIESSCLVGNCGTCMVDHCKGEVEHKGVALDEEQKKESMLSCHNHTQFLIMFSLFRFLLSLGVNLLSIILSLLSFPLRLLLHCILLFLNSLFTFILILSFRLLLITLGLLALLCTSILLGPDPHAGHRNITQRRHRARDLGHVGHTRHAGHIGHLWDPAWQPSFGIGTSLLSYSEEIVHVVSLVHGVSALDVCVADETFAFVVREGDE
ncbi:hypothetical protein HG530_002014 [Fusarium avenaceum]|nr:hypothetical protein HG530_002014 [Fusarium avenaceum]